MKSWFLIFLLMTSVCMGQSFETSWNDNFVKELHISCPSESRFCEDVCGAYSSCVVEERICRSCIGTGILMHRILSELGKSIRYQTPLPSLESVKDLILSKNFVAVSPRDVFNVIDGFDGIAVLRKFEALCPNESISQLLFIEVEESSRKILGPRFVYCQFEEVSGFYDLQDRPRLFQGIIF